MRRALLLAVVVSLGAAQAGSTQPAASKRTAALQARLASVPAGERLAALVFFRDKGGDLAEARTQALRNLSGRALLRRERRGTARALGFEDLPLAESYVRAVSERAARVRHELRWLNALSVLATQQELSEIESLPFVSSVDLVRSFRRGAPEPSQPLTGSASGASRNDDVSEHSLNYGTALGQVQQIGVPALHDRGLHGEGVIVAVLDAGFDNLAHEVFATTRILAMHDFVNGDGDVANGPDRGEGSHGTSTLSVLGGFKDGQLIGPAFAASFLLAKTEDTSSETPVEEDNWAAAAEWAEALGADVISSSLGYLDFDRGFTSYTFADMDGRTAISTRAAELAAARGIVVVNSAGNSGLDAAHNTLGAPSDGAHVLAVAAVTVTGERSGFSSVGPSADGRVKPDVAAQGTAVKVAGSRAGQYNTSNGTSFSCPLTAGAVALVLQAHPDWSVDDVLSVLRRTATNSQNPDRLLGYGIVDARAAVDATRP